MTTIAWDGKTLAADRRATYGNLKASVTKIFRLEASGPTRCWSFEDVMLFAWSGSFQDGLAIREYMEGNQHCGVPKPELKEDSGSGLIITYDRRLFRLENRLVRIPIREEFTAVGSGRDFAIAAMACGKGAAEAVELAARFDAWTGDGVDVEYFEGAIK